MTKYALRQAYLPRYAFSSFDCVLCFVERHTRMLLHLDTFLWGCLYGKLYSSKWMTTWSDHHKVPAQFLYVFSFVQLLFGCNGNWKYILWTHNGDENHSWLGKVSHLDCSLSYIALLIQLLVVLEVKAYDQICIEADISTKICIFEFWLCVMFCRASYKDAFTSWHFSLRMSVWKVILIQVNDYMVRSSQSTSTVLVCF